MQRDVAVNRRAALGGAAAAALTGLAGPLSPALAQQDTPPAKFPREQRQAPGSRSLRDP